MARFFEIALRLSGAAGVATGFQQDAASLHALSEAYDRAGKAKSGARLGTRTRTIDTSTQSVTQQANGNVSELGAEKTQELKPLDIRGPYQRFQKAQEQLREAILRGTETQVKDAEVALGTAGARLAKMSAEAPLSVASGPYQRLERATEAFHAAAEDGTRAQFLDAEQELGKAREAVSKLERGPEISGPFQRLSEAKQQFQQATTRGISDEIKDAQVRLKRAQEAVDDIQNGESSSFGQRVLRLLGSARIGPGGVHFRGVSFNRLGDQLLGHAGDALADGMKGGQIGETVAKFAEPLGKIAGPAAILATALIGTYEAAKKAAEQLSQIGAARTISGGTAGQVAGLQAMGFQPGEIAGAAASLREKLANDPFAQVAGARLGMSPQVPREFGGQVNEAQILEQALDRLYTLGKEQGKDAQRIEARRLGLESELPKLDVSETTRAFQKQQAATSVGVQNSLGGENLGTQANDFNAALKGVGDSFQLAITAFGAPAMAPIADGLRDLGGAFGEVAKAFGDNPEIGQLLGTLAGGFLKIAAVFVRLGAETYRLGVMMSPVVTVMRAFSQFGAGIGAFFKSIQEGWTGFVHSVYDKVRELGAKVHWDLPEWKDDGSDPPKLGGTPATAAAAAGQVYGPPSPLGNGPAGAAASQKPGGKNPLQSDDFWKRFGGAVGVGSFIAPFVAKPAAASPLGQNPNDPSQAGSQMSDDQLAQLNANLARLNGSVSKLDGSMQTYLKPGQYGGGQRAGQAVPGGYLNNPRGLQEAIKAKIIRMGQRLP